MKRLLTIMLLGLAAPVVANPDGAGATAELSPELRKLAIAVGVKRLQELGMLDSEKAGTDESPKTDWDTALQIAKEIIQAPIRMMWWAVRHPSDFLSAAILLCATEPLVLGTTHMSVLFGSTAGKIALAAAKTALAAGQGLAGFYLCNIPLVGTAANAVGLASCN